MKQLDLTGKLRKTGKKADVNSVRREERVPSVIYGAGVENTSFSVDEKELKALTHSAYPHIVNLDIEGKKFTAVMQDIQYHPVTDRPLHVDFLAVDINKPVTVEVPIKFTGNSEGVRAGGKLNTPCRKLKVSGVAADIPEDLVIDITTLGVGKQINAGDLKFDNIQIVSPKSTLVVAVRSTRNVAAATEEAAQ
ncbi:MAG: 50S ribosomal protein L25 [Bacteroidales bacterium]|nr:50S ribosomal protein L25 [Candidatus Cacconaster merdequi]